MLMRLSLTCLALTLSSFESFARATSSKGCSHKVKESIAHPQGWIKQAPASPNHTIGLRIALPQPNFHVLESHLYEVSDPDHSRYGAHLSKEEVESIIAPHTESIDLVNEWLASHGFNDSTITRSPAKDWAIVTVPVYLAEKMLDTKYHIWQHIKSGDTVVRTTSYSLPDNLHDHIDLIQPTTMFSRFKPLKSTIHWPSPQDDQDSHSAGSGFVANASGGQVDASCNTTITITCLKQIYNAVGYNSSATNGNQIGITGYLEEYANDADLQLFYQDQRPDAVNSSYNFVSINGGLNNQSIDAAGAEANLDVQFAFGLTYPTPSTFYSTGGRPPFIPDTSEPDENFNEPYNDWLDYVLAHPDPPQVISTSYDEDEQTVPFSYASRACNSFAQLGARGVSLFFSSGDGGVGDGDDDPSTQECFTNDGKNTTRFRPLFPSSCPFVTSVGGTVNVPEIAVYFSGGGFSDYYPRPSYQDSAIESYFDKIPADLYDGLFNRSGRGIPDVAAEGLRFRIYYKGKPVSIGGTSASSPAFAGFVSLLNDVRLSQGLSPLGFLNPFLYSKGFQGLNDITAGNNPGCGTPGFTAIEGWDPVTGLGTPNFGALKDLVLSL